MQQSENIRALIVHAEPIVAAGLMAVLDAEPGLAVAAAHSASSWLHVGAGGFNQVDVVIADYQGALEALAAIKKADRTQSQKHLPKVLVVTQLAREWEVRFAMNAGAFGYILQNCGIGEIVSGVRMVGASRRYLCEAVAERIAESLTRVTLTARETEVLELLQRGMCNKTIARDLGIAPGTVKAHVKGILEKLESTTRTQAVAVATHRGLIRASAGQPLTLVGQSRRPGVATNDLLGMEKLAPCT